MTNLTMNFGGTAHVLVQIGLLALQSALLFVGDAP